MTTNYSQFSMDLRTFRVKVERDAVIFAKRLALTVDRHLVMNTPVDTGRLRANWIPSLESPVSSTIPPFAEGTKGSTGAANATGAMTAMATVLTSFALGQRIWIVNNVEYLKYLNDGTTPTKQASPGFVEAAVQAGIREALRK